MALAETARYGSWVREVAPQERELGVFFDRVVAGAGTGSRHAGIPDAQTLEAIRPQGDSRA